MREEEKRREEKGRKDKYEERMIKGRENEQNHTQERRNSGERENRK